MTHPRVAGPLKRGGSVDVPRSQERRKNEQYHDNRA